MKPQFVFTPSRLRHSIDLDGKRHSAPVGPTRPAPLYTFRTSYKHFLQQIDVEPDYDMAEWESLSSGDGSSRPQTPVLVEGLQPPRSPSSLPRQRPLDRQPHAQQALLHSQTYEKLFDDKLWQSQQLAAVSKTLVLSMASKLDEWRMQNKYAEPVYETLDMIIRELLMAPMPGQPDVRQNPSRWSMLTAEITRLGGELVDLPDRSELPLLVIRDANAFSKQLISDVVAHEYASKILIWQEN